VGTWFTIGNTKNYHQQIYETGTDLGFAAPYTAISGCGICLDEHIPETLMKCGVNEMLVGLPLYEHVVFFGVVSAYGLSICLPTIGKQTKLFLGWLDLFCPVQFLVLEIN
jgi:hypothetical protein